MMFGGLYKATDLTLKFDIAIHNNSFEESTNVGQVSSLEG
jgi:hypothetical protein